MVSVIDAARGTVLRMGEDAAGMGGQLPGMAREAQLRAEIERLLAARVGDGKAIVTVAVETTAETETTVERLIDPSSRIAISTDTREVEDQGTGGAGGAATVASNLPVQGGGPGAGASSRSRTETEERINYEVSETTRERVRRAGEVSRVSVAVLVDGIVSTAPNGERVWTPRPESELLQLRDLVRSAIAYDEERGDSVTVETLEFAERPEGGTVATSGVSQFVMRNAMQMMQIGALTAVALGLAFFVLRPLLKAAEAQAVEMPERLPPSLEFNEVEDYGGAQVDLDQISMLRNAFAEQRDDSANVLRSWLERDVQDQMASEAEEEEA
jgi:flagellar M-ring protein FliF